MAEYTPGSSGVERDARSLQIEDREQLLEHLQRLGVSPYTIDDVVITLVDPDGRNVMFGTA